MDNTIITVNPRIINGILKWNEGDTFYIKWKVNLLKDGVPYDYREDDQLVVEFYNKLSKKLVYAFINKNIGTSKTIFLKFTKQISKLFKPGEYTYALKFMRSSEEGQKIITIGARFPVEVERCR